MHFVFLMIYGTLKKNTCLRFNWPLKRTLISKCRRGSFYSIFLFFFYQTYLLIRFSILKIQTSRNILCSIKLNFLGPFGRARKTLRAAGKVPRSCDWYCAISIVSSCLWISDCTKCTTLTTQTITCPECPGIKAQNIILSLEDQGNNFQN